MTISRLISLVSPQPMAAMAILSIALTSAAASTDAAPAQSAAPHCGIATLRDVEVLVHTVSQGTVTSVRERRPRKPGEREAQVYTTPGERQSKKYRVTVLLNDLVYTGESPGDEFWHFNPTRFVINDPIDACVREDRLILKRPDGKDYRSRIVRVMRER
ncbi:MAG: hypothetical protein AB7N65_19235 [Vicinamibacterales bacterium]